MTLASYLGLQRAQPVAHGCDSTAVEATWGGSARTEKSVSGRAFYNGDSRANLWRRHRVAVSYWRSLLCATAAGAAWKVS